MFDQESMDSFECDHLFLPCYMCMNAYPGMAPLTSIVFLGDLYLPQFCYPTFTIILLCVTGGLEMYPINPLNPPMYPEDKEYSCGHWLVEYEKIHNGELQANT